MSQDGNKWDKVGKGGILRPDLSRLSASTEIWQECCSDSTMGK